MIIYNTARSISYQLATQDSTWIIWCVMLLFHAHRLKGRSSTLIISIVRKAQSREKIKEKDINSARGILNDNHVFDLSELIAKEPQWRT